MTRLESAENQVKLRTMYNGDKVREAFSRFDVLERRVDEAARLCRRAFHRQRRRRARWVTKSLRCESFDVVDAELEAMKKAMKQDKKEG